MKKIVINSDNRRFNISNIVVGYLEENKEEVLEFEIPEKYAEYGKKACFSANGQTFAKNFDDIISNKLTITRDISQFKELDMTIEFFKIENEDEVVARTSILHILIENAIVCDDDVKPDDPKVIVLDNLIDEVTKLDVLVTKNEKKREEYYQEIQKKVDNGDLNGATFTPSVDVDGNISWTNDKNLPNPTTQNIKGPKGEKGDTYNLTEKDKQDISDMTVESSESTFNQYYNGKLEDFNSNATSKTNDYNTNATNKTTEYNNNAISKVNEFNTNTDAKLQEYNTNADNKIAEYDLHSQELDNKIIATRNELERVKNDVLETGTDTDTFVHLEDSAMAEYQELSVDGVCEQETRSGKNLANLTKPTFTNNGVTFTYNGDGTYTLNGTAVAEMDNQLLLPKNYFEVSSDKYYKISLTKFSGDGDIFVNARLDINGTSTWAWIQSGGAAKKPSANGTIKLINAYIRKDSKFINLRIGIQVEVVSNESSPATSWEPYGASPSPDYPQEIKTIENSLKITSCNKNLFDVEEYERLLVNGKILNDSGVEISDSGSTYSTYKIRLKSNVSYWLKGAFQRIYIYDENKNFKSRTNSANGINILYTPSEDEYISFQKNNVYYNENKGQEIVTISGKDTSYEQHLETQINANLPDGEFIGKINDKYKDTLKVEYNEEDGQYHLNLYKRVYKNNSYNGESYNYYISTTARKDGNIECGELQTGQIVYYGGDETIIDLGIVDQLITYNEITNLFTDSDLLPTINAKYYRNFISTVRNLQVNEKALKQELVDINTRLSALETATTNVTSESEVVE